VDVAEIEIMRLMETCAAETKSEMERASKDIETAMGRLAAARHTIHEMERMMDRVIDGVKEVTGEDPRTLKGGIEG